MKIPDHIENETMLKGWLQAHNYDGLYNTDADCGCENKDLCPCGEDWLSCSPGYKIKCNCGDGCAFHIVSKETLVNMVNDGLDPDAIKGLIEAAEVIVSYAYNRTRMIGDIATPVSDKMLEDMKSALDKVKGGEA